MSISLSVRPVDQQRWQLIARFYSKWYCATSGVDVLARRFRLALSRYIVCESVNVKVCQCQVMISNGLFKETNDFVHAINCTRNLTCMCVCACACDHKSLREQCVCYSITKVCVAF